METWDLERGDLEQAAADYERAVQANPHSDRDWLELAGIYERQGQISRAQAAYERAQHNHPISPVVAWAYGNFVLRQGNASEACSRFRKALQTDPELTEVATGVWWKSGLYASQPVAKLLPSENRYYFKALDYFGRQNEINAGLRVWDELLMLGQHFRLPQALPFIDEVIFADRVGDAQRMWRQALDFSRWPRDAQEESSLIFNGGFEHDFANGGFDWREQESADISFAFDTEVAHSGARSLRVTFNGKSNLDFQHVLQYVAVEQAHRYRFEAYLRSSALSTDRGMRFLIADPLHPAMPQIFTEDITGTQPWTRIEAEYVAGPETRFVSIVLRRTPSLKFDNKLGGTVWVDDVSLVALTDDDHDKGRRR
jgi:tetratricopeptide (TPR) repeat protein